MNHPVAKAYVDDFRTICEVHREMHDLVIEKGYDEKLIRLLEEAFDMAKKMNRKLRQYKFDYDDGWWEIAKEADKKQKLDRRKGNL
jgi:hypothetical protein